MFSAIIVLLSVLYASRVQCSFGFVTITAAKKQGIDQVHLLHAAADSNGTNEAKNDASDDDGKVRQKKTPTTKRKRKAISNEPSYWHDEEDPFHVVTHGEVYVSGGDSELLTAQEQTINNEPQQQQQQTSNSNNANIIDIDRKSIKFTIRGNPRVLIRHRTARGFMYNPSRASQEQFRDSLLKLLPRRYHPTIVDDDEKDNNFLDDVDDKGKVAAALPTVLFSEHEFLKLSVVFRMKRPKSHFVSNKPGPGRLKPTAPGKLHSHRSDVDNLTKFVMDSLNGLVYVDDRQVVKLSAVKLLDSEGLCRGATEVEISVLTEEDV